MSEREITGEVDEAGDRAISGMDRAEGDFRSEHDQAVSKPDEALQEGEDWAQDRTQESFDEGDVPTTR